MSKEERKKWNMLTEENIKTSSATGHKLEKKGDKLRNEDIIVISMLTGGA